MLDVLDRAYVGEERTSVVSTPSLAELYKFAMNFLLVRKRKRKRNRDGRKRVKKREKVKNEETAHMDDYVDVDVKVQDSSLSQM